MNLVTLSYVVLAYPEIIEANECETVDSMANRIFPLNDIPAGIIAYEVFEIGIHSTSFQWKPYLRVFWFLEMLVACTHNQEFFGSIEQRRCQDF